MRQAAGNSQRELCRSAWRESSNPLVFTSRMSSSMVLLAHLGFFFSTYSLLFLHSLFGLHPFVTLIYWFIHNIKEDSIIHPSSICNNVTLDVDVTYDSNILYYDFFPLILISINKKLIKIIKCRGPRASSQGTWVGEQQQISGGGGGGGGDEGCTPMMMDPDSLAQTYWHLHIQDRTAWTLEIDLRPSNAASLY